MKFILREEKKIRFFHGISRANHKGTRYIIEAFKIIEQKYADHAECIIRERTNLDHYLRDLALVDVVVDQVFSSSTSMNSVHSMSLGKIVLGGGEPEYVNEFKLSRNECPLIPVSANVNTLVNAMEKIIQNKAQIPQLQNKAYKFVSEHHDAKKIALQYIQTWQDF